MTVLIVAVIVVACFGLSRLPGTLKKARAFYDKNRESKMVIGDEYLLASNKYTGLSLRPSLEFTQQLEFSRMTIFTNDRGERSFSSGEVAQPSPLVMIGDSFALGSGNEYEDCFSGILQREYRLNMANLSVGTYSLLQVARHFEETIGFHHPQGAILVYNKGMVDRAFKDKAYMGGLGRRPTYVRKKGTDELYVQESLYTPSNKTLRTLHALRNRLIGAETFDLSYKLDFMMYSFRAWVIRRLRTLVKQLTFKRFKLVDDKENCRPEYREKVIRECVSSMAETAQKYDCKLLVYHMFEYRDYENRKDVAAFDDSVIQELVKKYDNLVFWDGSAEQRRFDAYMQENGITTGYFQAFKLPDDPHHARPGNVLMAESMFEALEANGMAHFIDD